MDKAVGILALVAFIAFLAVIAAFVPAEDLILVFVLVAGMAVWDFWKTLGPRRNGGNRRA